ncbi:MAG: phasin family protein [Pseudomonadota bacterium]
MADTATSKIDAAAEKAYAEAAAKTAEAPKPAAKAPATKAPAAKAAAKPAAKKAPARKAPARKKTAVKKTPAQKAPVAAKTAAKKTVAKKTATKKPVQKKAPAAATKKVAAKAAPKTTKTDTNSISKLKDTIMAKADTKDITTQAKEMASDVQERVKTAYSKAGEFASEAGDFNKANVEAMVESGKIFFAGAQEIVKGDVETGKTVVETVTEDAKKMAAVKSPTELMQLQGELARRNFDAVVSFGSQRTEAFVKLYNDAFAPISNRVSVAAEKFSKAA